MAELSPKVEIEIVGGGKCETGVSGNQDLANGNSRGGHRNGNAEEADGSYVFVSHNETVGEDQAKGGVCREEVENEGENVEEKIGNNGGMCDSVIEAVSEKSLGELEPKRADGGFNAEETKESAVLVSADDPVGDAITGNGEVSKLEPAEKVEESQDSEARSRSLPDLGMQEPVSLEEKSQGQSKSDLEIDVEENLKSEIIVSEVVQHGENEGKQDVDSGQGRESVDLISSEISLDGPSVDSGVVLEQLIQRDLGSVAPVSSETRSTEDPVSNENCDGRFESIVKIPDSDENVDFQPESEVIKATVSFENCDVGSESAAAKVHEAVKDRTSVENGDVRSESDAAKAPDSNEKTAVRLESRDFGVPDSDQNGRVGSESRAVDVPDSNENGDVQSESEAIEVPDSDENGDVQSESRTVDIPVSHEHGVGQLESKCVSVPAAGQDVEVHLKSEATSIYASKQDDGVQLQSEAIDAQASDEKHDKLVADPDIDIGSGTAVVNGLLDAGQQMPEQNGTSGPAESFASPVSLGTTNVENDTRVNTSMGNAVQGFLERHGLDKGDSKEDEPDVQSEPEVGSKKGECFPAGHDQESDTKAITGGDTDVCQNTDEEAKSLPPRGFLENLPVVGTETQPVTLEESVNATDFEVGASKRAEDSAEGAGDVAGVISTESGFVQSDETFDKPVDSPNIDGGKIDVEVKIEPVENGAETILSSVCKDTSIEENSEVSDIKENSASGAAGGVRTESEVVESKSIQTDSSHNVNNGKVAALIKNGPEENDNVLSCKTEMSISGAKSVVARSALWSDTVDLDAKTKASEAVTRFTGSQPAETDAIKNETKMSTCPGEDANTEVEVGVAIVKEESACEHSEENLANEKLDGAISQKGETSVSSKEGSSVYSSAGNDVAAEIERKPFYFLSRVPRHDNEKLAEEIRHAQLQVDKKTKSRDAIRAEIQKSRVFCKEYDTCCKAATADERSARDALRSKRQEIDSLQSVINRVKNAVSVDDIDSRMVNMEHMIQHETLPLKEEKQLIREIKQLKQLREQISSTMGTQDEVQQALDEKDQTEDRLKVLRKELDMLRNNLMKSEAVTKASWKKYQDERDKLNLLQDQFKAADAVRQEAFSHLQSLRKQSREKNKYFFKYRDDSKAANELALKKDKDSLQSFCIDQVETFMNLWNNDDEFRKDYIRCNTRSTLRRFGTLDGRSLGPDEEQPVISRAVNVGLDKNTTPSERPEKREAIPPVSSLQEEVIRLEHAKVEGNNKPAPKTGQQKNQTKPKKVVNPALPASGLATVSGGEEAIKPTEEEPKLSRQEEEHARKAEEKREQEEAAKLKEQRRLEETAKAKEAMERKKKKEEKAKARAALRAQKEAEEKEKEREKKLRKKERRKGLASDDTNGTTEDQSAPVSEGQTEAPEEIAPQEKREMVQPKKTNHKPTRFTKLNKSKPIPPPLRNRGKRRMQQWMWAALIALLVFALFLIGNGNLSFRSGLRVFGF